MSAPSMTMKEALLEPLLQFTSLSENLFRSLAPTNFSSKPPPPPPFSELARCDVQLASALHEARIHQGKQKEINRLAEDILSLEGQLREAIMAFADGKAALEERIEEGDDVLHRAAVASSDSLSYQEILTYASNLATFTSAPPTVDPLRPEAAFDGTIIPPFPTVEMMRRGKMNMEPPLGSLGEMREVGVVLSPSRMRAQVESHVELAHGGPTQYSTFAAAHHPLGSNPDDMFDLDLNPDF